VTLPARIHELPARVGAALPWLLDGGGEAVLVVEPPELGSVHIRLSEEGGAVELWIEVANEVVRDVVREAETRLGEQLREQGLLLKNVDVTVSGDGSDHTHTASRERRVARTKVPSTGDRVESWESSRAPHGSSSLLDVVA
jgi:flagellar hook-length control protein FliK